MKKQLKKKETEKRKSAPGKNTAVPVVAIGASAGGLEAMNELLKNLPADTGMGYVYLQHLSADYESHLATILSKNTTMPVEQIQKRTLIKADHVYIIPPGFDIIMVKDSITLTPRSDLTGLHLPIDQFFISLSTSHKGGAIGVILSGSATDGTVGLRAIKAAGGITIAQDESAKFNSMPQSAISEGLVDMVLSPKNIAEELVLISKNREMFQQITKEEEDAISDDAAPAEAIFNIITIIKKNTGVDFGHYKINTIRRRMVRRMLLYKLTNLGDYIHYIKKHPGEIKQLYNDLLINVTNFFRDPDAMEYLKHNVLSQIIKNKSRGESIRIWVPACSTGEEAYTVAILMVEALGEASTPVQIFASDLSENAIGKARIGFYSKSDVAGVDSKRLQRFFTKVDGGYRIVKIIRDMCVFAPHNLFKDPPFSRLDLITCCNLLIYLEPVLQNKMMSTFHYALNTEGYLMLGKSETVGNAAQLFNQLQKGFKIYSRKKDVASRAYFDFNIRMPDTSVEIKRPIKNIPIKERKPDDLERTVDDFLLNEYMPPSVVVNNDLEIIQFRGSTSPFLEPSRGKASLNLLKMARQGLAFELRNIIHKANKTGEASVKSGIEINNHGKPAFVSIEARPLSNGSDERLFLVVFRQTHPHEIIEQEDYSKDKLVKKLQDELQSLREDLRSIVEDQEASNEELQSANEEIVSSNEELQSINEELETSKEELESTNEELMTINQEMHTRNDQLAEAYDYAEAMFATVRESLLVLDKDLRIKTANRSFYNTFKVHAEETEGKYIYDLGNGQWSIPALKELLENIIPLNHHFTGFEVTHVFPGIGEKIMVLNARRVIQKIHHKELILLAIEDITDHRKSEIEIKKSADKIRIILESIPQMAWMTDAKGKIDFVNKTLMDYSGFKEKDFHMDKRNGIVHDEDYDKMFTFWKKHIETGNPFQAEVRYKKASDQTYRWHQVRLLPLHDGDGNRHAWVGTATDIHDQKIFIDELETRVEQRTKLLQDLNTELVRSNKELASFSFAASHDLQEPLRKIQTFAKRILEKQEHELTDVTKDYFNRMRGAANRMQQLILDLLAYSRANNPGQKTEMVDLNGLIKDVQKELKENLKEKNGKIESAHLPSIDVVPFQFQQLFLNIMGNSIKFAKPDEPLNIIIKANKVKGSAINQAGADMKKNYHHISISDNGIGFESAFSDRVFELFMRLHTKEEFGGTGIGLALCKKIMESQNGFISAGSELGEGTTIHLYLPA